MKRVLSVMLVAGGLMTLLAGCGFDKKYVSLDPTVWPSKPSGYDMPVISQTPGRAHRAIGEVTVTSGIRPSYEQTGIYDQVLAEIRKEARKRGADAVINVRAQDSSETASRARLTLTGTLIIFTAPPATAERS